MTSCHRFALLLSRSLLFRSHGSRTTSHVFSSACRLFVSPKKVNSFAIKQIQPLLPKHPGYGGEGHDQPRTLDDRDDAEDDMRRMSARGHESDSDLFSQTKNLELRANSSQPLRSTQT